MKSLWVMSWWLVVLVAGGLQAATPLQTLKNCRLLPAEWADGDSFRVRTPAGESAARGVASTIEVVT